MQEAVSPVTVGDVNSSISECVEEFDILSLKLSSEALAGVKSMVLPIVGLSHGRSMSSAVMPGICVQSSHLSAAIELGQSFRGPKVSFLLDKFGFA
jgi:hypothetical protein